MPVCAGVSEGCQKPGVGHEGVQIQIKIWCASLASAVEARGACVVESALQSPLDPRHAAAGTWVAEGRGLAGVQMAGGTAAPSLAEAKAKVAAAAVRYARLAASAEGGVQVAVQPSLAGPVGALTADFGEALAADVKAFARHAGRTTVQVSDVALAARRNESAVEAVRAAAHRAAAGGASSKVARRAAAAAAADDSDSDLVIL